MPSSKLTLTSINLIEMLATTSKLTRHRFTRPALTTPKTLNPLV